MLSQKTIDIMIQGFKNKPRSYSYQIKELHEELNDGNLIIDYSYQRNYLYEDDYKVPSSLVESIFMGIAIPEIQLFENEEDYTRELIDGQQRTLSLVKFYRGEYALKGLESLTFLNGYTYSELPKELQNVFKKYQIRARVINKSHDYKFELFERLNTGSKNLNEQEIRNCVYRGIIIDTAKELSNNEYVANVFLGITDKRALRTEAIIYVLSLIFYKGSLESSKKNQINRFLKDENAYDFFRKNKEKITSEFIKTSQIILQVFNLSKFFNDVANNSKKASLAQLSPLFYAFHQAEQKQKILNYGDKIAEDILLAMLDKEVFNAKSSAAKEVNKRLEVIADILEGYIGDAAPQDTAPRLFSKEEKELLWNQTLILNGEVKCGICGNSIHRIEDCEVDHIIPWSLGGETNLTNAQLSHRSCNRSKGNR